MPTMKDVAREAGVSLGTVSNVLNHKETVSVENHRRVREAVKRLGYRTNMAARTLKTNTSQSIGLIIPDIANPYYPELARGVEDAAKRAGLTVFLCNTDRNPGKEREYLAALLDKNVDGVICAKPQTPPGEIREVSERCAVVLADGGPGLYAGVDLVNTRDAEGTLRELELLYRHGHRRIAYITAQMGFESSRRRFGAYCEFLASRGIPREEALVRAGDYTSESGYREALALLALPEPPTAVCAANDLAAIGVLKAARERGVRVPEELSVAGFDDIPMAALCTPRLTTVRMPKYEVGRVSVELLLHRIGKRTPEKAEERKVMQLETALIERESVADAP